MSAPRVLVVEPAGNLWGSERALLDLLGSVTSLPLQVAVCCPPNTPIVERVARLPVGVYPTFVAGLHRKSKVQRLRAAMGLLVAGLRHRAHLLHVNQAGATRLALLVGRVLRIPVIAHVRLAEDAAYLDSMKVTADELPLVVCVSQFIRHLLANRALEAQSRIVVVYDPYLPQLSWRDVPLYQTSDSEPVFSCVGRLTETKGQHVALSAIGHLKDGGRLVHGVFWGTGEPHDTYSLDLVELAAELGISEQISWLGFQTEIQSRIAPTAALICSSHEESLGRVIFEAWDAGVIPVAWADSGGPSEIIQASGAGVLYEQQTGSSLATALQSVIAMTPQARQQMVENGRQWLLRNCDPQACGERMLSLWEDVARLA